jgi:hypothetical protein
MCSERVGNSIPYAEVHEHSRCRYTPWCTSSQEIFKAFTHLGGLRAFIAEHHCSQSTRRKITKVFALNAAQNAQVGEGL